MKRSELRKRAFFFITFAVLAVLAAILLKPFFSTIVLSLIAVLILKPLYSRVFEWKIVNGRARISASVTLLIVLFLIFVPVYFLISTVLSQLTIALEQLIASDYLQLLDRTIDPVNNEQLLLITRDLASAVASAAVTFGTSLVKLIVQIMIFIVLFVTLMPEFDRLVERVEDLSPLGSEISTLYYQKTSAMVSSLVKGIFLIGIIEGLIMGFFFWLAGIQIWFLLMMLAMVLAMLPVVGVSWLTIFTAIFLVIAGRTTDALIVLFGFYGIANWVDIVLRPKLVSKEAYMNFALILLGLLGGVVWAGFLGLFYGPVILLLLVTTIDIYAEKFAKDDGEMLKDIIKERLPEDDGESESSQASESA